MATKKISELTPADPLTGDELMPIAQLGVTRSATLNQLATLAPAGPAGPPGDTGPEGPKGDTGAAGADGDTGPAGTDGKTILNGTGAPAGGLGVDGDFYLDTATSGLYGPKTSGAWGSPTSLIGATGSTGLKGDTGDAGPGVPSGGAAGQVLAKNSTTDYDTVWSTPGSGALTKIASIGPLVASTASLDFSAIPQTYTSLQLDLYTRATTSSGNAVIRMQFNGRTGGGSYYYNYFRYGPANNTLTFTNSSSASYMIMGHTMLAATGVPAATRVYIPNYAQAIVHMTQSQGRLCNWYDFANYFLAEYTGVYVYAEEAISRVTFTLDTGSFAAGSSATLYGIS